MSAVLAIGDGGLEALVELFAEGSLPAERWTHEAHLAVGAWHVREHGPEAALELLRTRIRALNDRHGTPNSDSQGYHETVTAGYVRLLADWCSLLDPAVPLEHHLGELLAGPLASRDLLLRFWSREVLFSSAARRAYVEPDLAPLRLP